MDEDGYIEVEGTVEPDRGRRWYIHYTQFNPETMIYIGPRPQPPPIEAPSPAAPHLPYPSLPHTEEQEQECIKFAHAMQALANAIEVRRRSRVSPS